MRSHTCCCYVHRSNDTYTHKITKAKWNERMKESTETKMHIGRLISNEKKICNNPEKRSDNAVNLSVYKRNTPYEYNEMAKKHRKLSAFDYVLGWVKLFLLVYWLVGCVWVCFFLSHRRHVHVSRYGCLLTKLPCTLITCAKHNLMWLLQKYTSSY